MAAARQLVVSSVMVTMKLVSVQRVTFLMPEI